MPKPVKITLAQAARLIRRDHPGMWESMTPAERQQALDMLNAEREAEAAEQRAAADRRKANAEFEAFFRRQLRPPRR